MVDYGLQESSDQLATQALVFMVVALNGSFKLSIAHFFTTGISAQGTKNVQYFYLILWANCILQ
jgi:hypothetical protein